MACCCSSKFCFQSDTFGTVKSTPVVPGTAESTNPTAPGAIVEELNLVPGSWQDDQS